MVQSRTLWRESKFTFDPVNTVLEELDVSMREKARARLAKVQEIDLSFFPVRDMESLLLGVSRSLCKLDLSHNQLYELPEAIGSLLSLTHLFLNDNYLSSLQPIIIGRLVNLQELDLRNNKLNNFSLDITELSCLRKLSVQGNPLKDDETRKLMKLAHNERWIDIAGECKIL